MSNPRLRSTVRPFTGLPRFAASLFALLLCLHLTALAAGTGRISGTVLSKGTGNALQGAEVLLPALGRTTLTDNTGRFAFFDVPAGEVQVTARYDGFKDQTQTLAVADGPASIMTFDMESSEVVQMAEFVVESVKEGGALAITEQRNAANPKNVVALDEWGVLPTQNLGELFSRMPGITFTTDEDDLINNITVRGLISANGQSLTRLNIDGMSSTGVGGNGRTATLHSFSAAMYEQLEVIAGQTPDKRADGLGGQINLKTRSPLAMKEKRRVSYSLSGRYTPGTAERTAALADHPRGYSANFNYTEVFDFLGGVRNLGIAVNASHQQVVNQFDFKVNIFGFPSTTDPLSPAYLRDFTDWSGTNHRFISAFSIRADYRPWDHTTVSARFLYNTGDEPYFYYTSINPFFNSNAIIYNATTAPTGGIMPGSNQTRTEIRPTGNAQMLLSPRRWSFASTNPTATLTFEHDFGRLKIDHAYRVSHTRWDSNSGRLREGGQLTLRTNTATPIGFILDSTDLAGNVFTQTAGPSVFSPASYASYRTAAVNTTTIPVEQTSVNFVKRGYVTETDEFTANLNASYAFDFAVPLTVKAGLDTITREVQGNQVDNRRWYARVGTILDNIALMPLTSFEDNHGGQRLPVFDPYAVENTLDNSAIWYEDVNFNATQPYSANRYMEETVNTAYVQAQTKLFNRLTLLGGVRFEDADVETATWVARQVRTPIATEPDHYKRAARDFFRQTTKGGQQKRFPSIHAAYDLSPNFKLRSSWSTSYARPDLLQLLPAFSVSDTSRTVTIGNPNIKPQMGKNLDLKLEYYGKNSAASIGVYQKRITDYNPGLSYRSGVVVGSGADNGFDGLYEGYEIIRPSNIGRIVLEGIEFDFRQRLDFLPGALKGLTARGNYTYNQAEGELFFSTAQTVPTKRGTREIPGLTEHAGNFGLNYTKGKWGASYDVNYTGEYPAFVLRSGNTNTPQFFQQFVYRKARTAHNVGVTYRLKTDTTVYLNVNNITGVGQEQYFEFEDRKRMATYSPMTVIVGVQGNF